MKVRPLHDRIIVERIEETEQQIGSIIIPGLRQGKAAAGQGHRRRQGQDREGRPVTPLDVKAGDTVLFGKYAGQEMKIDGDEYLIMREEEVLGVIEK